MGGVGGEVSRGDLCPMNPRTWLLLTLGCKWGQVEQGQEVLVQQGLWARRGWEWSMEMEPQMSPGML